MEQQERQNKSNKDQYVLNNIYMGIQTYPPTPSHITHKSQ